MSMLLVLIVSLLTHVAALKFLAWNPIMAHSHANFQGKVSDALIETGHEVVMLSPIMHGGLKNVTSKLARTIHVPQNDFTREYEQIQVATFTEHLWTVDQGNPFIFIEVFIDKHLVCQPMKNTTVYMVEACRETLQQSGLLESLRAEKFDSAFGEDLDPCGFGIFHLIGIRKFAITQSTASLESSEITGVPAFPSFQPALMAMNGDEMTTRERLYNLRAVDAWGQTLDVIYDGVQRLFDDLYADFPRLKDISKNASYFFLNTEPLVDFPRLVSRKMIDIGGIALPTTVHQLPEPLLGELSLRPRTVLISFGSVMLSHLMPERFKQSIRSLALTLPNVTFIWKYEKPEHNVAAGIPNLITHTWLPQTDLLRDPRLSAFVTHGGAGSSYEAVLAGVPTLVIPVIGDQMRNGEMIKRIGVGRILKRDDLAQSELLVNAVRDLLENDKYRAKARTVAEMVSSQPQSVRERLVSHMEFMARFGPLDQLSHAGRDMSVITFYNLDIFAVLIAGILSAVGVLLFIVLRIFRQFPSFVTKLKNKSE